jgi:hypothetical protein
MGFTIKFSAKMKNIFDCAKTLRIYIQIFALLIKKTGSYAMQSYIYEERTSAEL